MKPTLSNQINFLVSDKIAYFPSLGGIKNAFSWGKKSQNMSYSFGDSTSEVHKRIINFLSEAGMSDVKNSVTMAVEHSDRIFILTKENIITLDLKKSFKNSGREAVCDCILTSEKEVVIAVKPGDCGVSVIQATSRSGVKIGGLIHTGTQGMLHRLASKAIKQLQDTFDCELNKIFIGICPSIKPDNYFMHDRSRFGDIDLKNWTNLIEEREGRYHVNSLKALLNEYILCGIPGENIFAYDMDTLQASKDRVGFSHSYSFHNNENHGRFMVAIELS